MKKILKTLLYIIGFPALVALVAYNSLIIYEEGGSYGFWPFVGLIVAGLCLIVFTIVFIVTGKNSKKNKGNRKKVMKSVATLVVMSFVLTAGIWLVVDLPFVLPSILEGATDNTRTFDMLHEDYKAQAEVHGNLLDEFILMNIENKNLSLDQHSQEEWLELGYSAPEVKELLAQNFKSMDANGYKTFTSNGPWLNMANSSRLTIPVLVHLVLNEREVDEEITYKLVATVEPKEIITDADGEKVNQKPTDNEEVETVLRWTILDMQGTPMTIDLGGAVAGIQSYIGPILELLGGNIAKILGTVNDSIADPALAGSELYVGIDMRDGGFKLALTPAANLRGMHGYQYSAWLNSNNLLFAVISLFPARQYLYIWGAVVIFASVAVAALRVKEYGQEDNKKKKVAVAVAGDGNEDDSRLDSKNMTPYQKDFYSAMHERSKRK